MLIAIGISLLFIWLVMRMIVGFTATQYAGVKSGPEILIRAVAGLAFFAAFGCIGAHHAIAMFGPGWTWVNIAGCLLFGVPFLKMLF